MLGMDRVSQDAEAGGHEMTQHLCLGACWQLRSSGFLFSQTQENLLEAAVRLAGNLTKLLESAQSHDVAFVNAHGTGTANNDRVESQVLNELLPGVPFLSTKAYTGHTLGAAGAIEATLTVACLEKGKIPTSAGFSKKDPKLPAHPVQHETPVSGAVAISQSLAFGGNNSAIIFGKENH